MQIGPVTARSTFTEFRASRHRATRSGVRVTYVPFPPDRVDVAFAISKKVGTAVIRNRLRRQVREIFRTCDPVNNVVSGSYLVSLSPGAAQLTYQSLRIAILATAEEAGKSAR